MTVIQIINQWEMSLIGRKSNQTIKNYIPDATKFFDWYRTYKDIGVLELEHLKFITPAEVDMYTSYLHRELSNSPQTINRKICSLRAFFEYVKEGLKLIDSNVMNNVSGFIVRTTKPAYCGTTQVREAVDNIKTHYKIRDRAMILFDAHTGVRREELSNVKISDIDFEHQQLFVLGKGAKPRYIDLSDDVIEIINDWLTIRPKTDNDYLFVSERKNKMSVEAVYHVFKQNLKHINNKFSTHTMRRTFITTMLENGVPSMLAKEFAGHASVQTTEKYFITSPEGRKKAVNSIKI